MPIYAYECPKCAEHIELQLTWGEAKKQELPKCTTCGTETKRVLTTGTQVVFKGSGWTPKHYR